MDERKMRVRFSKTGAIKYISHLDLTRVFLRALGRADIELKHSEGFSPHPKLAFGVPLSVGAESICEACDFTLAEDMPEINPDEIKNRLKAQLPAGLDILSCTSAQGKLKEIAYCDYELTFEKASSELIPLMENALLGRLIIMKRCKKGGEKEQDITDMVVSHSIFEADGTVKMTLRLPCSNELYLNPDYVVRAMRLDGALDEPLEEYGVVRKMLYYADFREF